MEPMELSTELYYQGLAITIKTVCFITTPIVMLLNKALVRDLTIIGVIEAHFLKAELLCILRVGPFAKPKLKKLLGAHLLPTAPDLSRCLCLATFSTGLA